MRLTDTDSPTGYRDWIEYNTETEALRHHSTFTAEHHFTGLGQISASLNLLTYFDGENHDAAARHGGDDPAVAQSHPTSGASGHTRFGLERPSLFRHRQGLPLKRIQQVRNQHDGRGCNLLGSFRTDLKSMAAKKWRDQDARWEINDIVVEPSIA